MKYLIQIDLSPEVGAQLEQNPEEIQEFVGMWQAHNPDAMYFAMTRRRATIIVDAPNEDSFFEALHRTWVLTQSYPQVDPVATMDEFGKIMERLGMR